MEMKLKVAEFAELVGTSAKTIHEKIKKNSELPVTEKLLTVNEKVNGRGITLIVTNTEQITYYKSIYSKESVNNDNCNEILTDNNSYKPSEDIQTTPCYTNSTEFNANILNQFINVNNNLNDRYEQKINEYIKVNNELAELKSMQKLLEDKAGREGFYLNEINGLEKDNNELRTVNISLKKDYDIVNNDNEKLKTSNKWLLTGLVTFFIISIISSSSIIGIVCYYKALKESVNNLQEQVTNDKKPAEVQEVVTPPAPQQVKKVVPRKK